MELAKNSLICVTLRVFTQIRSVAGLKLLSCFLLLFVKAGVVSIPGQQFLVGARFNHPSLVKNYNTVKFKEREDPVGNDKSRFILKIAIQVADNFLFRPGIYCAETVIENDDFMIPGQCPGDRYSLFLSSAQSDTSFTDHGIITRGKLQNFFVNTCIFCSFFRCR